MATSRERRIAKELKDIKADQDSSGVYAEPIDPSDLTKLKGVIPAPPDTPYAGAKYTIDIQIPDGYPFKAPIMKFDTRIWHPNVSSQTVRFPLLCTQTILTPSPALVAALPPSPLHPISLISCASCAD
jgi:ubiquitin-protein ligase